MIQLVTVYYSNLHIAELYTFLDTGIWFSRIVTSTALDSAHFLCELASLDISVEIDR